MKSWDIFSKSIFRLIAGESFSKLRRNSIETVLARSVRILDPQTTDEIKSFIKARQTSSGGFADKAGKVTCTLNIASVDLHSKTIVLTRNNPVPVFICRGEEIDSHNEESISLGTSRNVRPVITEIGLEAGLTIVIFTDGISHAGERRGQPMNVGETIRSLMEDQDPTPQQLADTLLAHAISLDDNRPADDISVLILKVTAREGDDVRRMSVRLPING